MPTLLAEIALANIALNWLYGPAATLYFGGGTPSLHPPEEIASAIAIARRTFGLLPDAEVTLEANPGTLTRTALEQLKMAGVTRISLGGQSFSDRKLKLLYRDHTAGEIAAAFAAAREAGITNISLDLIFGLPDETLEEWSNDLEKALALSPDHISLYNLEYHEATPFYRWRERGRFRPLEHDFETELYLFTHERLTSAGFDHYEVSNFARPGFESKHNSAYWRSAPYLGVGPSAHSYDGYLHRYANVANVDLWRSQIEQGKLAHDRHWQTSPREKLEEWISLRLRRSSGILFRDAVTDLGEQEARALWTRAAQLPVDSCEKNGALFRLTPRGWFRENTILAFLFEHL